MRLNGEDIIKNSFFEGSGYTTSLSAPSQSQWDVALQISLDSLINYGYDYYLSGNENVVVYHSICSENSTGINFELNVGINFEILCN